MGKATRWFRSLLGMKKDNSKEHVNNSNSNSGDRKEKKRWSFAKSSKDSDQIPGNLPSSDAAWLRSYIAESEKEQNKHAIAVAAATAAAADAAVAAAQAAVAVVRLTSNGRGTVFGGGRERWAAVKIQTVFRGFLARKALRALKGLVKLQALVRGYLVRKRATATLHSMQALIRAQVAARTQRARRSLTKDKRTQSEYRARKSIERFDETRSESHSKRVSVSASVETSINGFDESPKIVEIDSFNPQSRSRRIYTSASESGDDPPFPSCPVPSRVSIPADSRNIRIESEWNFIGDECRFSTAHSTPRFANSGHSIASATPAKSVCADSFFRPFGNYPNYMANTQSFRAKLRSYSAPKQRPEPGAAAKMRLPLSELMASRNSISGVRMQRSCLQLQEGLNF